MEHDKAWFERVIAADKSKGIDLDSLKTEIEGLASFYDKAISRVNDETFSMWGLYVEVAHMRAKRMMRDYGVQVRFVSGQPYETPEAMYADIEQGKLYISQENNTHPILTPMDNMVSRVWHDLTHYKLRSNFGFLGECETMKDQALQCNNDLTLTHVLHCDIVLQVAWGLMYREFPPQKVLTLEDGYVTLHPSAVR